MKPRPSVRGREQEEGACPPLRGARVRQNRRSTPTVTLMSRQEYALAPDFTR